VQAYVALRHYGAVPPFFLLRYMAIYLIFIVFPCVGDAGTAFAK
jgi:hypothetical protein